MGSLKEEILKLYPNVIFKNELFLSDDKKEKLLRDFSLEDIAFRLSQLDNESAWKLNMYLYNYGTSNIDCSILKFLVKNNISYFKDSNDDNIYKSQNLIKEFERIYSTFDFTVDDLKNVISENEQKNKDKAFYQFDISHLMAIIMIQKLYRDKKINIDDFKEFTFFVAEKLKKGIISSYGNYDSKYEGYVNETISYLISGKISLEDYFKGMSWNNPILDLLVSAKFENVTKVNTLPIDVVMALNSKRVNSIFERILAGGIKRFDNVRLKRIVINMCALLGEHNVDNIVKCLPEDEYAVCDLLFAFNDIDISNVLVNDRKIIYNEDFIKFFMGNKMNDPTSLLNLIYSGKTILGSYLENLYYSFNELYDRYKKQDKMTKKVFFEEFFKNSKLAFNPDEYKLEGPIINSYFDNRKHQSLTPIEFVKEIRKSYAKMKHNYQKSIPYVSGTYEEYSYETLMADDPIVYAMGAYTDCCFKIGGQADSFVKYCAEDKNARVIAIKDKNDKVVAMIPMIRNGNLIVCNSIESYNVKSVNFMTKMFEILEIASGQIIDISSKSENIDNSIQAVICGNYKNFIEQFNKYNRVGIESIEDFNKLSPLQNGVSCNLGMDAGDYYCIKSIDNFDFARANIFNPVDVYEDPRRKTYELEIDCLDDKMLIDIQKKIDSIAFESKSQSIDLNSASIVIFNDDWYIVVDNKNNIYSSIVGTDPRAFVEYNEYLELEREYYSNYDKDDSYNVSGVRK